MKKLMVVIGGVCILAIVGVGIYMSSKSSGGMKKDTLALQIQKTDDFQRTGENSFGLDVCNEMSKEEVGTVLGKIVSKTRDYSNNMSTGCEYYIQDAHFVIVDVGYGDMEKQRKGLEILERKLGTESRIGLPNFLSYSDRGLIDVYMNIAPTQKFVRVGRSSTTVTSEEELLNLAIAVEKKVRSYK